MKNRDLALLGEKIAALRIAKAIKQADLAYEAGISPRTLQRIEAGEVVKTDGLLKVIRYLGRMDELIDTLAVPEFSPYGLLKEAGVKPYQLREPNANFTLSKKLGKARYLDKQPASRKRRVRTSQSTGTNTSSPMSHSIKPVSIQWPEDQK